MRLSKPALDLGDAAMFTVAVIWATNNVLVKAYVERIGAVPYVFARFVLVCILLFSYLLARGASLHVERRDWKWFLLTGVTGYAAYNLLFTIGLERTSAFSVAILVGLGPVFTLILTALLRIERVRPLQWLGVACAMTGVLIFVGDKLVTSEPAAGDVISVVAAVVFAIYSLATRPIVRAYGSPLVTAWSALVGLVASLPITLGPALAKDWRAIGMGGAFALLYSSALSMLVAYTIWGWAIERKGVGRTVPYLYLVPVITAGLALLFLDERFGPIKIIGAALVLAGIGLARRGGGATLVRGPAAPSAPEPALPASLPAATRPLLD